MPTVYLAPMPKMQFFSNTGVPLNGGYLYTYAPGTTTNKATYADSAGTTPNTTPIVLDSAGRASIWLDGVYDMELWTGDKNVGTSTQVWTQANVASAATATAASNPWVNLADYASLSAALTAIGSNDRTLLVGTAVTISANTVIPANVTLWVVEPGRFTIGSGKTLTINGPFVAPDTWQVFAGAGSPVFSDTACTYVTPEHFGTGTDAIALALATSKDVVLSAKTYSIGATLEVGNQTLRGAGASLDGTIIEPTGNFPAIQNAQTSYRKLNLEGFFINYGSTAPTVEATDGLKVGIKFVGPYWPEFTKVSNVVVQGGWYGFFDETGTYQTILERVFTWNCRYGFHKKSGTTIKFDTCFALGGVQGFYIEDTVSPTLVNCASDQITVTAAASPYSAGNIFLGAMGLVIDGWDAETNHVEDGCSLFRFNNCVGSFRGFSGVSNTMEAAAPNEVYLVKFDGGSIMSFDNSRTSWNGNALQFTGNGVSTTIVAIEASIISMRSCLISHSTGGSPSQRYAAVATGTAKILNEGTTFVGTVVIESMEDTWTPIIGGTTTDGTYTYTVNTGQWVKNDGFVDVQGTIQISGITAAATGDLVIRGLADACKASTDLATYYPAVLGQVGKVTLTTNYTMVTARITQGEAFIRLIENGSAQTSQALLPAALAVGSQIFFTIRYPVA